MSRALSEGELDRLLSSRAVVEDDAVGAALAVLRREIESTGHHKTRTAAPARARPSRRRWAMMASAGAAAGVASLAGISGLTGSGAGSGLSLAVSAAAAAQLDRVAHAAAAQPPLQAGQWKYVATTRQTGVGATAPAVIEQDWYAPDGSARERVTFEGTVTSDKLFPDPGSTSAPTSGVDESSAPSDPQALLAEIARAAPSGASVQGTPVYFWAELRNVLLGSRSPQLSAMAFEALKYLPDTTVVGSVSDLLGRAGIAISFVDPNNTTGIDASHTIIVSSTTGEILESYDKLLAPGAGTPTGSVTAREVYTQQGVVSSDTALPDGRSQPLPASFTTSTTPDAPTTSSTTSNTTGAGQ